MPRKKQEDAESSVIVSRVQQAAQNGERPKGEKENSIIRSRVIHGAVETGAATPTRKKAARTRSTTPRARTKRTTPTPTSTET